MTSRPTTDQAFGSARAELPMLYAFLVLAGIELLVVHLLVSFASVVAAWILSTLSLAAMLQIGTIVWRVKRRPTLVTGEGLTVRSAKGFEIALPWNRIASVEAIGMGPEPGGPDVLRAALMAYPNMIVRTTDPVTIRRLRRTSSAAAITLRVDDPERFGQVTRDALRTLSSASAPPGTR